MPRRIARMLITWGCNVCGYQFDHLQDAIDCEGQDLRGPVFELGTKLVDVRKVDSVGQGITSDEVAIWQIVAAGLQPRRGSTGKVYHTRTYTLRSDRDDGEERVLRSRQIVWHSLILDAKLFNDQLKRLILYGTNLALKGKEAEFRYQVLKQIYERAGISLEEGA